MKIENLKEKENKLLERKEVVATIVFEGGTPKRDSIKKELCEKIGANPERTVLRQLVTNYGSSAVRVQLHVYENAEKMKKLEPRHLLVRDNLMPKEEKKKKEKKAPAKKESK